MTDLTRTVYPTTTKGKIIKLEDSYLGSSTTKRGAQKDSVSKFFLMDCFMKSRSKSNINNDSSINHKGNSLEIRLRSGGHVQPLIQAMHQKPGKKSKSPANNRDSSNLLNNKSA